MRISEVGFTSEGSSSVTSLSPNSFTPSSKLRRVRVTAPMANSLLIAYQGFFVEYIDPDPSPLFPLLQALPWPPPEGTRHGSQCALLRSEWSAAQAAALAHQVRNFLTDYSAAR